MKKLFLFFLFGVVLLLPVFVEAEEDKVVFQGKSCGLFDSQTGTAVLLPFFKSGNTAIIDNLSYTGVEKKCLTKTITIYLNNSPDKACPQGYKLISNPIEKTKECVMIDCSNTNCPAGEEKFTITDSNNVEKCVCVVSGNKQCICPHDTAGGCVNSPFCQPDSNAPVGDPKKYYTGLCLTNGTCQSIKDLGQNNSCIEHYQCWEKGLPTCCDNKKNFVCDDKIDIFDCKNAYQGTDLWPLCPPGFQANDTFGCISLKCRFLMDSKIQKCEKDSDCKGTDQVCTLVDDLHFTGDTEKQVCIKDGLKGICEKKEDKKPTKPQYEDVEFSIPPTEGLNQLKVSSVPALIGNIIKTAMGVMGSIALIMFVYGGVMIMTATGSADRQKKGVSIIVWATMGIVVILSSYIIVDFVFKIFQ